MFSKFTNYLPVYFKNKKMYKYNNRFLITLTFERFICLDVRIGKNKTSVKVFRFPLEFVLPK